MIGVMLLGLAALPLQSDWLQWRGSSGDAVSSEPEPPIKWSQKDGILWKAALPGAGNSCPIVIADKVIVTASDGASHDNLMVLAFDRRTGKPLWNAGFFASRSAPPFSQFPPERGHAAPSPASNGKVIVALFGSGDLVALDLDGKPLWIRSLSKEFGPFRNEYGISVSPLIVDDRVIIQIDHAAASYVLAASLANGKTLWKTGRDALDGWATPVIARVENTYQVICLGTGTATAYDLQTGRRIWNFAGLERLCSATPTVRGTRLIATSGPRGVVFALNLAGTNDGTPPRVLWQSKRMGPFIPSPLVTDQFVLVPDDQGMMSCLDFETGLELWKERMAGRARPSAVAAGDLFFNTSLDGTTIVGRLGNKLEKLSSNGLGEQVAASPAIAKGNLFIRGEKHLWCIGK